MQELRTLEIFPAMLGGDSILCASAEDAEGITRADEILGSLINDPYPRELIEFLAQLLRWYDRHRAARTIEERHLTVKLSANSTVRLKVD